MLRVLSDIKRTHWVSWSACRRRLRRAKLADVTPARFDVLQLLYRRGATLQRTLQRTLGVVKSSASELLAKLESLGFIERSRVRHRVGRRVALTEAGRRAYRDVWDLQTTLEIELTHVGTRMWFKLEDICISICNVFQSSLALDIYADETGSEYERGFEPM
jgi:DNA-binding MarR family transcriptional regulator